MDPIMVATSVSLAPYLTSFRLLRCIIISGRESEKGQKEPPSLVAVMAGLAQKAALPTGRRVLWAKALNRYRDRALRAGLATVIDLN